MDLREILFAQFPAFFLLSLLFLIAHLRVRKHSAVKSVLWVLLFGAALAVSILFCFLGMQAKYWTVKTLFELKFWSWLALRSWCSCSCCGWCSSCKISTLSTWSKRSAPRRKRPARRP